MAQHDFDPFHLTSGLPLSGADVTVTEVEFGYDNEYSADACVAIVHFQPDEGEARKQLYSTGRNFEPADRGDTLVHNTGKNVNVSDSSNYGILVNSFLTMEGADEAMAVTRERGATPFDAAWLKGMRFTLGDHIIPERIINGKVNKEKTVMVFAAFLGLDGEEAPAAKPAAKKATAPAGKLAPKAGAGAQAARPAAKPAAKAAEPEEETFGVEDDDLRNELIALAQANTDHGTFLDVATELDAVMTNRAAQKAVMDTKPGSLWATYGGG